VGIGEAHGGLNYTGIQIGYPCGTEEGEVVPYGTVPTAIRTNLADKGIAKLIGPIGAPISDDVGVSTNVGLGVAVNDL
jgi:hypothetical protein